MAFAWRGFLLRRVGNLVNTETTLLAYEFASYPIDGKPAISFFKELLLTLSAMLFRFDFANIRKIF
jgi:hypothetical protein